MRNNIDSNTETKENPLADKSKKFSIRIIRLYQYLSDTKKEYILSKQILRSGTSIGANVAEANVSFSLRDFIAKMYIAYKESAETQYWLDLLVETGYIEYAMWTSLSNDCEELRKMLSSSTKTARQNLNS